MTVGIGVGAPGLVMVAGWPGITSVGPDIVLDCVAWSRDHPCDPALWPRVLLVAPRCLRQCVRAGCNQDRPVFMNDQPSFTPTAPPAFPRQSGALSPVRVPRGTAPGRVVTGVGNDAFTGAAGQRADRSVWRRYVVCAVMAALGISASVLLGVITADTERNSAIAELHSRATLIGKHIENRIEDVLLPLSALAVFLESQPSPNAEAFRATARKLQTLGVPIARLSWEPRIQGSMRETFEADARRDGLDGYQIRQMAQDGELVPADPSEEYIPIRLEATDHGFPSLMGFDMASDPVRRAALVMARDTGRPIGIFPQLRQVEVRGRPVYLVVWPLFDAGPSPETPEDRRRRLTGFVSVLMPLHDIIVYAMSNIGLTSETVLFQAATAGSDSRLIPIAIAGPGEQPRMIAAGAAPERLGDAVFHFNFRNLLQQWAVSLGYPATALQTHVGSVGWLVGVLAMAASTALVAALFIVMRNAERDRRQRLGVETLMTALEDSNHALSQANLNLRDREQASVALARDRTRFLAAASHDLRQPLHALLLFTTALSRRVTGEEATSLVRSISEIGLSLQAMFNSLLDLSRLDMGAVHARVAPAALDPLVRKLVAEFTPQAREKGLSLRVAGRFPTVRTDTGLLESVLRNLIGNAIKFTDRGGVLIAGRQRGWRVSVEIWDTGPGIPDDKCAEIFDEFTRLDDTAGKPGFGLGLPIVRRLCDLIGATLHLWSRRGRGSRFAVLLPIAVVDPSAPEVPTTDTTGPARRILVVDDEPVVLRALHLELSDQGHVVTAVATAKEAFHLIDGPQCFDCAIFDLNLSGRNAGWDLVSAWRRRCPDRPVIVMTGSTDPETLRRVDEWALPTLFKPVPAEALHAALANPAGLVQTPALSRA